MSEALNNNNTERYYLDLILMAPVLNNTTICDMPFCGNMFSCGKDLQRGELGYLKGIRCVHNPYVTFGSVSEHFTNKSRLSIYSKNKLLLNTVIKEIFRDSGEAFSILATPLLFHTNTRLTLSNLPLLNLPALDIDDEEVRSETDRTIRKGVPILNYPHDRPHFRFELVLYFDKPI